VAEAAALHNAAIPAGVDTALNQYLLAGLLAAGPGTTRDATPAPPRSPDDYVRALFDPYADDFEQHLVQALHYRGHTLVAEAARAAAPRFAQVLDLGCGTGLCGRLLAPVAGQITGVDLSPTMVAAARRGGAYHQVLEAEALAFVAGCRTPFDLVVAADVFIYIGALAPLFAGLARCQPPGGLLVATVESGPAPDAAAAEAGWWLQPSLRYAHGHDGTARLAEAHGYALRQWRPAVIREEQRQPIHGAVLVLERRG
jgi:predicted TPR repeat methyltransferase